METTEISIQKVAIKAGLLTLSALIIYFMLMKYMGFIHIPELRALNFFILLGGIFFAFRYYRSIAKRRMEYLQGLMFGFTVSAVGVLPFALFVGMYFLLIDPVLLGQLNDNTPLMGPYLTPITAAGTIVLEGMISGVITSFSFMQYYKNDHTHV